MASSGSMTAAVWLAPMVPTLPLPLAQRVQRLLTAKPGRETETHALWLCEGIIAYAACLRASVAAAVCPREPRSPLARGLAEFREALETRGARADDFERLLLAASEAIEAVEVGHPLGRSELTRPRTAWNGPKELVEALAQAPSEALDDAARAAAVEGGTAGLLRVWVCLIERHRDREPGGAGQGAPVWLGPLGDSIVDVLGSALLDGAVLAQLERGPEGGRGRFRRLHGLEAEDDEIQGEGAGERAGLELGALATGPVCWRFSEREISSHGLLRAWVDEHEFDHVGIVVAQRGDAEHLDYGSGQRCAPSRAAQVDWDGLYVVAQADEAAVLVPEPRSTPIFALAGAALAIAMVLAGVTWALWPVAEPEPLAEAPTPTAAPTPTPTPVSGPDPVAEIVIASDETGGETGGEGGRGAGLGAVADETGGEEDEAVDTLATASLWFESERNLGTCQVTYEGRTRTANLHLRTRQPAGELEFAYRCGQYRGRGSIEVKLNRVNGVLFCKKDGAVKVKTVRTKGGRCDR